MALSSALVGNRCCFMDKDDDEDSWIVVVGESTIAVCE